MSGWVNSAVGPTTTTGSLQTLATVATNGTHNFCIDLTLMANADELLVQILKKAMATGGTALLHIEERFRNIQAKPVWNSGAIVSPYGLIVKIQRTAGADHAYDWSLDYIA